MRIIGVWSYGARKFGGGPLRRHEATAFIWAATASEAEAALRRLENDEPFDVALVERYQSPAARVLWMQTSEPT